MLFGVLRTTEQDILNVLGVRDIYKLSFASSVNVSEPTNSSMVIPKNFANLEAVDNLQSVELS